MILYDAPNAPSARRVRMVIAEKGLTVERHSVDLRAGEHLTASFRAINPQATVPVLVVGGIALTESAAICRYLEAIAPEPPLFGRTPIEIALIEQWCRRIEEHGYRPAVDTLRNGVRAFADRALPGVTAPVPQVPALIDRAAIVFHEFAQCLDDQLRFNGWISGEHFSFADIAAIVAFDFAARTGLRPGSDLPDIARWYAAVCERTSSIA